MRKCIVHGCTTRGRQATTSSTFYHRLPAARDQRKRWLKEMNINTRVPPNQFVCSLHFTEDAYMKLQNRRMLKSSAVPTLKLGKSKPKDVRSEQKTREIEENGLNDSPSSTKDLTKSSEAEICCIPDCPSLRLDACNMRYFCVPKEIERRSLWHSKISHKNFTMQENSRICHKHFEDRFIVKGGKSIAKDGSERMFYSRKWRLTDDAIPTLFPTEQAEMYQKAETVYKVETTCRTCSIQIYEEKDSTPLYVGSLSLVKFRPDIFKELVSFGLQIEENDDLPQQICQKCLQSFSILIQFRKQCQRVQSDLRKYFKDKKDSGPFVAHPPPEEVINLSDNEESLIEPIKSSNVPKESSKVEKCGKIYNTPKRDAIEPKVVSNAKGNVEEDVEMMEEYLMDDNFPADEDVDVENWICEYYIQTDENKTKNTENLALQKKTGDTDNKTNLKRPHYKIEQRPEHKPIAFKNIQESIRLKRIRCKLCQRLTKHCCEECPGEECPGVFSWRA